MPSLQGMLYLSLGFLAIFILARFLRRKQPAPFPPGPKGLPFVGNVLDRPSTYPWLTYSQWGRTYGDIVYVNILGQPIVILNSAKRATAILDKKSVIYSDRPTLQMSAKLMGWDQITGLIPYGNQLREHRRYFSHWMGSKGLVKKHHVTLFDETRNFLKKILVTNEDISPKIRNLSGAIMLKVAYGYTAREEADPLITLVEEANKTAVAVFTPGLWLVDTLPILRHLPTWFPGARFKREAARIRKVMTSFANIPYEFTKNALVEDVDLPPNIVTEYLTQQNLNAEEEDNLKWAASSMYIGGIDSTTSATYTFILAMMLYPNIQRRAQAEIDRVVGDGRFPSLDDRERLPFIEAIVKEIFRWRCPTPVNIPHSSTVDDIFGGYYIPKGTMVVANIWAILHDLEVYPNPDVFDPSRFVTEFGEPTGVPDPYACFGYGRRCPGNYFAEASIFIRCAMILAVYDISKATGPDGRAVEPSGEYTSGASSHPKPFKCSIAPRSEKARQLIFSSD